MGPDSNKCIMNLGKHFVIKTGENKSKKFFLQRISIRIQRSNAASIVGTSKMHMDDSVNYKVIVDLSDS